MTRRKNGKEKTGHQNKLQEETKSKNCSIEIKIHEEKLKKLKDNLEEIKLCFR